MVLSKHIFSVKNLLILIPTLLVIIWFRDGNIMGTGESGLPFYNPQLQFDNFKYAWANYALGHPTNISIASVPTYWFLSILDRIGIPNFIYQAMFFWLVLVISGVAIASLTKLLFPKLEERFIVLSILFYWFNPFAMVNIWNRFLNNFLVFFALLPVVLFFFIKGIQTKKYLYALLIGLSSVVLSYSLTSLAFDILLWFLMIVTSMFYFYIYQSWRGKFFVIKFFCLTLFFWVILNLWWISQVLSYVYSGSFGAVTSTSFITFSNYDILTHISNKLGNLVDVLRLEHKTFFSGENLGWVKVYSLAPVVFLKFLVISLLFVPLILKRKNPNVLYLTFLFFLGAFLAKGNNPPFGEAFNELFLSFPLLQVLRNPFEKFGFLFSLAAAPLFSYGASLLTSHFSGKWSDALFVFVFLWVVAFWGFPFWSGLVFTSEIKPANVFSTGYQIIVPKFYQDASQWIKSQSGDFRLIALPLSGEGITYEWEKGYTGVELTNQLLPITAVSFGTNIPFYEQVSSSLERNFFEGQNFSRIMNALNAKYIMVREDIDWREREMRNPKTIISLITQSKSDELNKIAQFGKLNFWENLQYQNHKIYTSDQIVLTSPKLYIGDLQIFSDPVINANEDLRKAFPVNLIGGTIIHPSAKFSLNEKKKPIFEISQDTFPHINVLPSSPLYPLILLKDNVEIFSEKNLESLLPKRLSILGKRLVEAKFSSDRGDERGLRAAIGQYDNFLKPTLKLYQDLGDLNFRIITQDQIYLLFQKHLFVLQEIEKNFSPQDEIYLQLEESKKNLQDLLVKSEISPPNGFIDREEFPIKNRMVYKFEVPQSGEYELWWGRNLFNNFYQTKEGDEMLLQIDSKVGRRRVTLNKDGYTSFGKLDLTVGQHQIGINGPIGLNLVDTPNEVNLRVDHGEEMLPLSLKNFEPFANYNLSFDYWIIKGSGVKVSVKGNNSRSKNGQIVPWLTKMISPDPDAYDFSPKKYASGFKTSAGTDDVMINLTVKPWNSCESIFLKHGKERCKDENFSKAYDRTTEVQVKNLVVTRQFNDEPTLVQFNGGQGSSPSPDIEYKKDNNTQYLVSVKNARQPYVLIFSDLFDPGWKIIADGKDLSRGHFLANGYANGWLIGQSGDYQMIIKYAPQDVLNITSKVSIISFILSCIFLGGIKFIKNAKSS